MISYGHGTTGFVLTSITLVFALFAWFISFIIIIHIIYEQYHRRLEREGKITLLLSFHIYLFIFIFLTLQLSIHIQTLIGDINGNDFYSASCVFRGYFALVSGTSIYFTFVIQAMFRLCRIVYSNYGWLQSYRMFMFSGLLLFIGASILISPLVAWHDVTYLPQEHYCYIVFMNIRSTLWIIFFCYLTPVICLFMIHIRITIFLRRQPTNIAIAIKKRQKRDLLIIQRIFISIGILFILGLPGTVITLMPFIIGVTISLDQRIILFSVAISLAVLSVAMILMTPQLKKLVLRKWQQNRVMTIEGMIPMRNIAIAQ